MSDNQRTCSLVPLDGSFDTIPLPHNQVVTLGRGPVTNIADKRLSRKQVEFTADCNLLEVTVKIIGPNLAGFNGFKMEQNSSFSARQDNLVALLFNKYIYRVEFNPPPQEMQKNIKPPIKRMLSNSLDSSPKKMKHQEVPKDEKLALIHDGIWDIIDLGKLLIFTAKGVEGRSKIAAYDIDGTIITTKSGRVFPIDCKDWKLAFNEVSTKLKSLWNKNYKIVFFSNQAGIGKGKVKVKEFQNKVLQIIHKINVPIQVYIATDDGYFRKPAPGMWYGLEKQMNDNVVVDISHSFYCGDAAGREANWAPKKKKDFSCSDRLFAMNVGLKFYTPEEHFLGMPPARFKLPDFNPSALDFDGPICDPPDANVTSDEQEVVIMVGFQGSGKSTFTSTYLVPKGYISVNRDQLGSWQKCISVMESALNTGKSVVIDNTNPDKESRKRFIEVAAARSIPCRCFVLTTSIQHAKHNIKFRELVDKKHQKITDMMINMYKNKYEEPSLQEGFSAVLKVNCVPKIDDPNLKKAYQLYLLDK